MTRYYPLTDEDLEKILTGFAFNYSGKDFHVGTIGHLPYGCLISLKNGSGSFYASYPVDVIKGEDISIRVRPEGDFATNLERELQKFFSSK